MNLHNELFAMKFCGIRLTPARSVVGIDTTSPARRVAPWPDFHGNRILEGDVIQHPVSGERGTVVFLDTEQEPADQWRVDYRGARLSRLCLQIGEKGRAVVVRALPNIQS